MGSRRRVPRLKTRDLRRALWHSPEQLEFIFDEFHQVEVPGNGAHQSFGLGLNIVQRIANLLKLELGVRSEADKGSVFSIVLPAGQAMIQLIGTPPT